MYGSAGTYQQTANDEIVLLPMMETKTAVENMESILDVEGINGVYVGPSDLGFSYGLVPKLDRDEPEILKIYEKIVKECGKRGFYPGIHCSGADGAVRAINMGFKLVTLSNESGLMATYAKMQVDQTRKESGRQGVSDEAVSNALMLRRPAGPSRSTRALRRWRPSFETQATPAPQDEVVRAEPPNLTQETAMTPAPVIRLHPDDGVLIARSSLPPGMVVAEGVTTVERIPAGHKVAIKPIAVGEPIRRYGQIIGFATMPIAPGQHVHVQNCGMGDFAKDYAYRRRRHADAEFRSARDLRRHPPRRRPRRDPQLHRHPHLGELQRACRRHGRRYLQEESVHRR